MEVGLDSAAASRTAAGAGTGAAEGAAGMTAGGSLAKEMPLGLGEATDGDPGVMLPPAAASAWRDSSVTG